MSNEENLEFVFAVNSFPAVLGTDPLEVTICLGLAEDWRDPDNHGYQYDGEDDGQAADFLRSAGISAEEVTESTWVVYGDSARISEDEVRDRLIAAGDPNFVWSQRFEDWLR